MRGPELEAQLLGAVFSSAEPMKLLQAALLHPETFSDPMWRTAWAITIDLARQGKRTTAFAVFSIGKLTKAFKDDDFGVLQSLESRSAIDLATFTQVAQDLRRVAHSRVLSQQLGELAKEVGGSVDAARAMGRFEALRENFMRLHAGVGRRGPDVVTQHFGEFDRRKAEGKAGWVTTGIELLDKATGGLPPKLCMVLGPPGVLKTGLAASMLERQCAAGVRPLVFSFEDGTAWAVKRPLAKRLGMPLRDVFSKDFPDGEKAAEAGQELSTLYENAWFCGREHARTPEDVVRIATQLIAQQGIQLVWVDNARAVKCEPRRNETRRDATSRMYELFADWSHRHHTPLVLLAHTTRKYEERTRGKGPPVMSDIGETGDAEKDVRYLLSLWRKWNRLRVTVGKHTEGEAGATFEFATFADAAMVDADSGEPVDLEAEKKKERDQSQDRSDEEKAARDVRRARLRAQVKQAEAAKEAVEAAKAKAVEAPPQLELIPGGKPEEPKP